ncbi:hypothetical protein [Cohnella zeiphila]|uniref:Glycosyltransferase 2-like domain-containing protein n=1 Tax=Cohnella zeiphila TaxID=2761120 RepID=A0A7X0STB7_9BACL|nr:hypothetical protein [Cohnella zeiphila]MBB6734520.1 hypothetical protein [Cohnella zeiphila]
MESRIPCVVLFYYNAEIIVSTMEFLLPYSDRLAITVLENKSIHTDSTIKPYLQSLVNDSKIERYVLFDENITMNAYRIAFEHGLIEPSASDYLMLTDGDLIVPHSDFLTEQLNILDRHPELFACGVSLSMHNLPLNNYPDATSWIPGDFHVHPDYVETVTGFHLLLLRAKEFAQYLDYSRQTGNSILDIPMHHYCHHVLGKKWGKTKLSQAVHLTWDVYADSGHPYQEWKSKQDLEALFVHDRYCQFQVYSRP